MNRAEEETVIQLLRAAQSGDEGAYSELFERYAPLIDSNCKQFSEGAPSEQELRSEAIAAFWHAICAYDVEQANVTFGLFARICVSNQLISCLRKWRRIRPALSLDSAEMAARLEADDSSNPANGVMEREQYLELRRMMESVLSPKECRIWELFIEGRTALEIAELLKVSKKSVENAIFRARKKLKENLPPHF